MSTLLERALKKYENADLVTKMKARFFFILCMVIPVILLIIISYTSYMNMQNPYFGYKIQLQIIVPLIVALLLFLFVLVLIVRGHFRVSAHLILILLSAMIWTVMTFDRAFIVSRLDTISYIFVILSMTSLAVVRNGTSIIVYGAANLALLTAFIFFFGDEFNIPRGSLLDYLADNAIAMISMTIVAFIIFSLNRSALNRANKEISERVLAEDALRENEERYRTLFENSRDAIVILEAPLWTYVSVNKAALDMFRIDPATLTVPITGPWDLAPEVQPNGENSREMALQMLQKALTDGWCFFEYRHRRLNGDEFPATVLLSKCELSNRTLVQATMRDVTERKLAEEQIRSSLKEKEALLKEIHHRVKNNLQIIISLLNLQSGNIKDADLIRMFNDSTNRIRAMALVHEKLYLSEDLSEIDFSSYIKTIAEELHGNSTIGPLKPLLYFEADSILLGIDQAIPCGLIVNELITNSLKYAFPDGGDNSEIRVSLRNSGSGDVLLAIADNGVGIHADINPDTTASLGLQLVSILVKQIQGTYTLDTKDGTRWAITFRIAKPQAQV